MNIANKIFENQMSNYTYKQMLNINNIIFSEPKINNFNNNDNIYKRRNNSVKDNELKNEIFKDDIIPTLKDINNNEILNCSF